MPEFTIPTSMARGLALARAAEAMLRAVGGVEAKFRLPSPLQAGESLRRELGLEPILTEEVAVSPVLVRRREGGLELLVSSKSLESHLHLRGLTAEQFLDATTSVQAQGRTMHITQYAVEAFAGAVYLYRITAKE